jgi:protein-S-isoprenylcysteine O-methyltransferase Ste14
MQGFDLISALWCLFGIVWLIGWMCTKRTQQRQPFARRLMYGFPIVIGWYFLSTNRAIFPWAQSRVLPRTTVLESIAVALTAAGIALAMWARFYLGQNWSSAVSIKVDHTLIRSGPYRFVRHPIYSGLLVAITGTALARGRPIGVITIAMFWLAFRIKMQLEEEFMRKTFGPEYDQYASSTGALVPKL